MEYNKQNKKFAYASINMDNFSTIVGTRSLEICATQISKNIFKFLESADDDEYLQRHCHKNVRTISNYLYKE